MSNESHAGAGVQLAKIPKQIDGEVFLFGNFVVKQCFPGLLFGAIWWIGFQTMHDGIWKFLMTGCFALASFIFGKRMGSLILYEYTLLFIRFVLLQPKLFLQIRRDPSFEPDIYEPGEHSEPTKKPSFFDRFASFVSSQAKGKN